QEANAHAARANAAANTAEAAARAADAAANRAESEAAATHAAANRAGAKAAEATAEEARAGIAAHEASRLAGLAAIHANQALQSANRTREEADGATREAGMARVQAGIALQAAVSARSTAAGIADPANTAIALTAPFAGTDVGADFATEVAKAAQQLGLDEAAKAEARATEAVKAAEAAETAARNANAQGAPAFKAAAEAARSSAAAARSAAAAIRSSAQAAEDAAKARAAAARAAQADTQAQGDARLAREAAQQAFADAAAARTAATQAEAEAQRARDAAGEAERQAIAAGNAATLAEKEAATAQAAAEQAAKDAADAARLATSAEAYATSAETAAKNAGTYAKEAGEAATRAEEYQREEQRKAREEAARGQAPPPAAADADTMKQALAEAGLTEEEYRAALELSGQDILDYLIENGGELLVEMFAEDIMACIEDPDIPTCLWAIISVLPVGKLLKLGSKLPKITKAIWGIGAFLDKVAGAKKKLKKFDKALDRAKKATKCLTDDGKGGKGGKGGKTLARASAGPALPGGAHAGMLRTGSGSWLQSSAADDDDLGCGPYVWVPFRKGVDKKIQGKIDADIGEPFGAFLRPGEYNFIVRLDGSLRAAHIEDMRAKNRNAGHTSLGEEQPVLMAGEFIVGPGGVFTRIENFSGHYMPLDTKGFTPLKEVTRAAFLAHGWVFPDEAWEYYSGPTVPLPSS
ncbi:hypothetical protein ACFVDH_35345, partial [Streptomyces sp. NPDC057674]